MIIHISGHTRLKNSTENHVWRTECDAALYESGYCIKHKLPLKSARRRQGESSSSKAYFKTSTRNFKSDVILSERITSNKEIVLILALIVGFIISSCVFLAICVFFIYQYQVVKDKWLLEIGNFGLTDDLIPCSFSYNELKKATNGFKEELGKGSFGRV